MGLFGNLKENKQAAQLEAEVRRRVRDMDDPDELTEENLSLQIYVMKSDIERYKRGKFAAKSMWGNQIDWDMTIKGLEGMVYIYERVIDEGFKKWLNHEFLDEEFNDIKKRSDKEQDRYKRNYYDSQLKAIAGLQERELYYSWTNPLRPIDFNPTFVDILNRKGLLYTN